MLGKFSFKNKNPDEPTDMVLIDETNIPKHVAIIMDGNGRWAKKRGLPRISGHHEGMKTVKKIVKKANDLGIEVLTLYAFSTENWKRPKTEVDFLMKLPQQFLLDYLPELIEENVEVRIMGSADQLPPHTLEAVETAVAKTEENTGMVLNFALNYGSRHEMTEAVRQIAADAKAGKIDSAEIDESMISERMLRSELKDPDLLIRTSGELRLSNFMLWQLAYTELWFTDVLWPDFTADHLVEAAGEFARRGRRYGNV
jgi:undecaprenyl diphosphate synthase